MSKIMGIDSSTFLIGALVLYVLIQNNMMQQAQNAASAQYGYVSRMDMSWMHVALAFGGGIYFHRNFILHPDVVEQAEQLSRMFNKRDEQSDSDASSEASN